MPIMIKSKFNFKSILLILILFPFISTLLFSQGRLVLTGNIVDNNDKSLRGATVTLIPNRDTTEKFGAVTDKDGKFEIEKLRRGDYKLEISFIGFEKFVKNISMSPETQDIGKIKLKQSDVKMGEVNVEGQMVRQEQKDDTTIFNAGAFKVNPDATTEDLIKKMPGVTVEQDGTVKAQGENVKRVLVDGKEFFGEDPTMALKSLPAEIIDKIQVYDRASDQAQFTGFDDGNAQKTLNIITKQGTNIGNFGKLYGGYGTEDRYWAGGNVNYFKGDTRISVIGMSNNINQQNFAMQDILSASGAQSSRRPGGFGGGMMRPGGSGGPPQGMMGGGGISDFMVGQSGGISTTNSVGLNYSDVWSPSLTVNGSYFFNLTNNDNNSQVARSFISQDSSSSQFYNEDNIALTKNYNHRFNARLDYKIDTSNSILFTPRVSLQANQYTSAVDGSTLINTVPINQSTNNYNSDLNGYNIDNTLLYRYKFPTAGRTFSLQVSNNLNKNAGDTRLNSESTIFQSSSNVIEINQDGDVLSDGYRLNSEVNYTEPVTNKSMLQFTYRPSYTVSNSDKEIYNLLPGDISNRLLDTTLSNNFENIYFQQRAGLSYSYRDTSTNLSFGLEYQDAKLDGKQLFPSNYKATFSFSDYLPNARFQYNFSKSSNFRVYYRTATNAPSISQLQNVIDNSNPLSLKSGNPDLKQNYTHTLITRIGSADPHSSSSVFAFAMLSFTNDYIANSLFTARKDTTINNIPLFAGSQLTKPVNLDGFMSARTFLNYGLPLMFIQSNFNLNGGFSYTKTPGLINDQENTTNNYAISSGFVLASNISPEFDFTIAYNANYSIVKSSLMPSQNNEYFIHVANIKFNWIFWENFVLNSEVFHNLYKGLGQDFNQEFLLWNASFGYKFLEKNAAEIRLSVYDILGQNNSITRNVTEIYLEDLKTVVLQRYFMLTFTYSLRKFN
jgi:hypothetical protein